MLKRLALCLFLLLTPNYLARCSDAQAAQIVVDEDGGGRIDQQVAWMQRIVSVGDTLRFIGMCESACTLGLGTPGACVEPTATFGFHLFATRNIPNTDMTLAYYRRHAYGMLAYVEALDMSPAIKYRSAEDLVAAGIARWCDSAE